MPSTNQVAVIFDHQYLWKESIDTLDILFFFYHKGKVGYDITIIVCRGVKTPGGFKYKAKLDY